MDVKMVKACVRLAEMHTAALGYLVEGMVELRRGRSDGAARPPDLTLAIDALKTITIHAEVTPRIKAIAVAALDDLGGLAEPAAQGQH